MTENSEEREEEPQAKEQAQEQKHAVEAKIEDKSFFNQIESMLGKVLTIVNPESHEDATVGHQIRPGWYRARLIGMGNDYIVLMTEFTRKGKQPVREPVRQYIPTHRIKRISLMKGERLLHL